MALSIIQRWQEQGRLDRALLEPHGVGLEILLAAAAEWHVRRAAEVARVQAEAIERLAEVFADDAASPLATRCAYAMDGAKSVAGPRSTIGLPG